MGNKTNRYLVNINVMIVDPNAFMRSVVRNVLYSFGCNSFVEAEDGADALNELRGYKPDIILTEWRMEPLDGIEFTRMLRTASDSPNPFIPIIMMTAHSEMNRVIQARDTGVTEFIVKPLSAKTLVSRIVEVIERPRPFVKTTMYFGPDRRRRSKDFRGPDRRADKPEPKDSAAMSQEEINALIAG